MNKKKLLMRSAIILVGLIAFVFPNALNVRTRGGVPQAYAVSSESIYYVSKSGDNSDGLSWSTAWNELDQIDWSVISPGDVVYLDGGSNQMIYETELHIRQSGQSDSPITIQVSNGADHDGQVIFFGGRENPLPYCGQQDYDNTGEDSLKKYAIRTHDHDHVLIDGGSWRGIAIHGYSVSGVRIDSGSTEVTVRYVEVYNNGEARQNDDGWASSHAGIRVGGQNVTFQRVIVHDNGQDAFQSLSGENNLANFRLEQSWLYNGREHPTEPGKSANYCTHTDGIQIYDGGVVQGVTLLESIIGPGFTQGIMLGQVETANGSWADVQDVTIRDVVFTKATDNTIMAYRDTNSKNWVLDHVTAYCPNTESHCLVIENDNHQITNSIIAGGLITFPDGLDSFTDNCQWEARGFKLGEEKNPGFTDVSSDGFTLDDYSVDPDSSCKGSRLTSVEQLLSLK